MATPQAVQGIVVDAAGIPIVGVQVDCSLNVPVALTSDNGVADTTQVAFTDSTGKYTFNLYANADYVTPTGTSYGVVVHSERVATFSIVVPQGAYPTGRSYFDVSLDSLVVAVPPTPGPYGSIAESQVTNLVANLGAKLAIANNLSELTGTAATARTNLGLGSAAVADLASLLCQINMEVGP